MDKNLRIKVSIDSETTKLDTLNSKINSTSKGFNQADSMAATFLSRLSFGAGAVGGLYLVVDTLSKIKDRGFEVNQEFQKLTNSLTTSSAVMMANNDIYGNAVSVSEKYRLATIDAARTTELLNKANLNTPHSMGETVKIYDSMYFSMKKVGASTKDMVEITEKLSIAAGNKVPFDAFLSAMDGIATGTVEANSEMGMFLRSVGLSNEEIKNSSDVVQLFKDKLSEFQAIQDFETKMSNLNNSTDMFAKNITKIPFSWWEDQLGGISAVVDRMNDGLVRTIVSFSNVSSLSEKNDLILKRQQLLQEKNDIKNDKFMFDSEQKTKIADINKELSLLSEKMAKIYGDEDKLANIGTKFDSKPIDDLVEKTLNPYGAKIDEITKKWQNNFEDMQKNGRDTSKVYAAWNKDITDLDQEEADKKEKLLKANEKLFKEQEKSAENLAKALLDISQIGMSEYDKGLVSITEKTNEWIKAGVSQNDILIARSKLLTELNSKTQYEAQKEELGYYERKIQLQDDSISKELELQGLSYANRILEIENTTKSIDEKNKLIAKETELFNLTVQTMNYKYDTEFQDTMSSFYDDMLDSQIALNNAVFDFGSGFDGVSNKIGGVSKSLAAMGTLELTNKREASKLDKKYIEQFNKYAGDVDKTKELEQQYTKDTALLNQQNVQAQIEGYANIAGAMANSFDEGSKAAEIFTRAQAVAAMMAGTTAVLKAAEAPPPIGFASMLGMAATVTSILANAGIAFGGIGGTKTTTTSDAFSSMEANIGTGSVLGDVTAQSESISNSLGILQDFAQPEFELLGQMNKYLASIDQKIGGVSSLLIQNGGFAFGEGFTASSSGYKNDLKTANGAFVFNPINDLISKIPIVGQINGAIGSIINSAIGGIFGKTSVSQSLKDSGITFANQLLTQAINDFDGSAYQTILTAVNEKSWFKKSSSTSINSYFDELDNETERQFSLVLNNLYSTTLLAGVALDSASENTAKSLENYVVSLGKISLKDKTGAEIQELLTSVFGKVGDDIAKTAFPALTPFQQVGEGMFETLTRVATGMETADYYISRLGNRFDDVIYTAIGNKQGDVGFEALLQSIQAVEVATYPANNNLYKIVENLDATSEELYSMYTNLDELRDRLIFLKQDAQALSNSMIYGAGNVSALDDGFKAYFENFLTENEQLTYKTQQLIKEFNNLGIALPTSKDGFKDLLSGIDKTSESGQEFFGRLIILSEEFAGVADSTKESIDTLTSSLEELSSNQFDTFISSIDNVGKSITSVKNTALSFLQGLNTSNNASLEDQLISYNKLRAQFAANFDSNGLIKAGANESDVSGLYSQISSLATNIAGQDDYLKNSLINQFQNDMYSFNASEDVIRVNIVDGLGSLYNLTNLQLSQLQTVAADGKITASELNQINGLTQTQKDGILDFVDNSSYFSKENTLTSIDKYMKKQLEVLQKTQDAETANISKTTFTYGDYVGKQEQIGIAKILGVSYETAKPLVEQLQALSVSKNPTADLQKILGYSGKGDLDYNKTTASQVTSLSSYLTGINAGSVITSIDKNIVTDKKAADVAEAARLAKLKFEADKVAFYSELTSEQSSFDKYSKAYLAEMAPARGHWSITEPNYAKGNSMWTYRGDVSNGHYNPTANFTAALTDYNDIQALLKEKAIRGYAVGTPFLEQDQLLYAHQGEIITPRTFSDGIRNGDLVMGDNNKVVAAIESLEKITTDQAREIQKMAEALNDFNTRDLIKTLKGAA